MLVKRAFQQIQFISSQGKTASREKKVVPIGDSSSKFLRFRAISALETDGPNGNWDSFLYEDFADSEPGYGYKSFIGKRAHHEHNSVEGVKGSIGSLEDAYLNKFIYDGVDFPKEAKLSSIKNNVDSNWLSITNPKYSDLRKNILNLPNQRDGSVEVLMKVDLGLITSSKINSKTKQFLQRLGKMIDTGQKLYCSMGTNVQFSTCSTCGNKAQFASEYCDHLTRGRKGALTIVTANQVRDLLDKDYLRPEWLKHVIASTHDIDEVLKGSSNKGIAVRNQEINHKLSFFELSIVGTPAFIRADALEKIANKVDGDYLEYLKQTRASLGDDTLIDLYSLLQDEGKIASTCEVKW